MTSAIFSRWKLGRVWSFEGIRPCPAHEVELVGTTLKLSKVFEQAVAEVMPRGLGPGGRQIAGGFTI